MTQQRLEFQTADKITKAALPGNGTGRLFLESIGEKSRAQARLLSDPPEMNRTREAPFCSTRVDARSIADMAGTIRYRALNR